MPRLLLFLLALTFQFALHAQADQKFSLPRRTLPLEKCLLKLSEAGAELSYRPDQIPPISLRCPGGRRTLANWLTFLLRDTELTFDRASAGYLIYPDPDLPGRQFTLYGTVTDARSGERLIAAAVRDTAGTDGALTNEYGLYGLTSPGGRRTFRFSYVGYTTERLTFVLRRDTTLNITLRPEANLPEVIVTPTPGGTDAAYLTESRNSIGPKAARELGGPGGVKDPLRVARLLAGVETGADGIDGVMIRGSEAGHNLVLLDGVPVYNLNHAAGMLSNINNEAIRKVDIYKDGVPARFGGRIGGVIDVHTRDGNLYDFETSIGADLLTAGFTSEGPLKRGKGSFLVAGRSFWGSELLGRLSEEAKQRAGRTGRMNYEVYDVNLKLNQSVGPRGHLYLSLFNASDEYSNGAYTTETTTVLTSGGGVFPFTSAVDRSESVRWGSTVGALRYNHVFNDHFFGNFRLSYSDLVVDSAYEKADSLIEQFGEFKIGADVFSGRYSTDTRQLGAAFDGQVNMPEKGMLRFGGEFNAHRFLPLLVASSRMVDQLPTLEDLTERDILRPVQLSGYGSYTGHLGGLRYRIGLRGQWWRNGSDRYHLSPRILLAGRFSKETSWRLTYDQAVQPIHLISSTIFALPSDLWVPATEEIGPSTSRQIAGQLTRQIAKDWNLVMAAYYRRISNLANYTETGDNWRENLSVGEGFASGLELTVNRTRGKLTGWANYSLAESRRDFDERTNQGRPFNFRYARRHSLKALLRYQPSANVSFTAAFRHGSGAYVTLSPVTLRLANPADEANPDPLVISLTESKNGVRLPANHRLDINAHLTLGSKRNSLLEHAISVGVYNVYNQRNPIYYDIESNYESVGESLINNRRYKQGFIPGFLPALSYRLRIKSRPRK